MTADLLMDLFRVLYAYIAIAAWVFVILYSTRKWFKSAAGWNYMVFQATMAVLFTLLALPGEGVWRQWVWLCGLIMIALVVTHRVFLIAHDLRSDARER